MNNTTTNIETMRLMLELTKAGYSKAEVLAACGVSVNATPTTPTVPQIAYAEATEFTAPTPAPTKSTLTVEEFLSSVEVIKSKPLTIGFEVVDFKPDGAKKYRKAVKYNGYIPKPLWEYNHIQIRAKYPAIKYNKGHYYADDISDFAAFAQQYHITTELTPEMEKIVKEYHKKMAEKKIQKAQEELSKYNK